MPAVILLLLWFLLAPAVVPSQVAPPPAPDVAVRDSQQQKTGTARMSGRVLAADTGRPLRRAVVRTSSSELREGRSVSTDADGHWALRELPAGRYTLSVSKGGYVTIAYGQLRPFEQGKALDVAEGQVLDKLDISLPRGSVIAGRILDEFGEPVSGVRVLAMRHRYVGGQRRLVGLGSSDMTDDIGQYRLHGLSPGDYYVQASLLGLALGQSDDRTGYPPTFYPGTPSTAEAQRITVGEGQEAQNVSFSLTPTRVATISGTAVSSAGRPLVTGIVMMTVATPDAMMSSRPAMLRPDGTFTISNVAPGEYRLQVQHVPNIADLATAGSTGALSVAEYASMPLTVTGQDITGLALVTAPAATAAGRIVFEGGVPPNTPPGAITIGTIAANPGLLSPGGGARVRDDWTFEATGLSDRRFFRVGNLPAVWSLKSVSLDGIDVTDSGIEFSAGQKVTGIEIVMTQRVTELSGTVQDSRGRSVGDYVVVAFSPDSSKWGYQTRYVRAGRPNQDGRFQIRGLPPDDYLVVALEYLESGEETDPEQLEKWKSIATRVALADGEQRFISLKLAR